jgi:hypothetical protein
MKIAYISNGYNAEVLKIKCRTQEEYDYWNGVISELSEIVCSEFSMHETALEEMDVYEVER